MRTSNVLLVVLCTFLSIGALKAQTMLLETPNVSPKGVVEQTIGLSKVQVEFHRPAVNDREIWGQLIPFGTTWRAGANENTIITFSSDVKINGEELEAGTYGFHIIPESSSATLIFSSNSSSWGSYSYQANEDALRINIQTRPSTGFQEYLTFSFGEFTSGSAVCALEWGDRSFPFTIETDVHEIVLANIREQLRTKPGWTWQGWHEAANYCLMNNVNLQEGLAWAHRSVFMQANTNNMVTKAKLTARSEGLEGTVATTRELEVLEEDLANMSVTWKEYLGAATYAQNNDNIDLATAWTEQSVNMHPTMTNMMAKHDLLVQQGEQKKANKVKEAALERGSNAELNIYAYRLMWSGKVAEAVEVFEANAERHPEDPNVWDSLGEGYMTNGQNEKAIEALRTSISLEPTDAIRANSLRLLQQMGVDPEDVINP